MAKINTKLRRAWGGAWFVMLGPQVSLGVVEKLLSGRWQATIDACFAPSGCTDFRKRSAGVFDTRRDAIAELRIQVGHEAKKLADDFADMRDFRKLIEANP